MKCYRVQVVVVVVVVVADAVVSAVVVAGRGKRSPNSIYINSRSTALAAVMLSIINNDDYDNIQS